MKTWEVSYSKGALTLSLKVRANDEDSAWEIARERVVREGIDTANWYSSIEVAA